MKVAIQGGPASFHAAVATRLVGPDIEFVYCDTFAEVFRSLTDGTAEQGVIASENSLFGSIREVYDLLLEHRFPIINEDVEHIHEQLITHPGTEMSAITEVYSHPVALDQCRHYLEATLPHAEIIEYHDTADAVRFVKERKLTHEAAIAGTLAAEHYDMTIIAHDIEDEPTNLTRFLLIDPRNTVPVPGANRASLVLTTANRSGALYQVLGIFAAHGINLTKLESRPIRGEAFRYQFYVDAETDAAQLTAVTDELEKQDCTVVTLGHYPAASFHEL